MTISDSYFKAKRKRYARGGVLTQEEQDAQDNVDTGVGTVAGLGSGIIDAAANTNDYGRQSTGAVTASSALKGVAAGAALGPAGMFIGGAFGAISGFLKGNRDHEQERKMIATQRLKQLQMDKDQAGARLSANPELMTGSLSAQYFKMGGRLKKYAEGGDTGGGDPTKKDAPLPPLNNNNFATWNKVVDYARSKKLDPSVLDHDPNVGYGVIDEYNKANPDSTFDRSRVKDIQSMMIDYRQASINKMKAVPAQYAGDAYKKFGADYAGFMPGLSGADNFPGSKTLNWKVPDEYLVSKTPTSTDTSRVGYAPLSQGVVKATGGSIHIKESHKGLFTKEATTHGSSVQGFASQVLSNKDNYSPAVVKRANFARNFGGSKATGGPLAYNPNLAAKDKGYQDWYSRNKIAGIENNDYDFYSYYRNGNTADHVPGAHFPDTYKLTNHRTFSNESIYATPENPGGSWKGDTYIPAPKQKAGGGSLASSYLGKAVGGSLTPESSDGVEVNGPTHADGGVDLPQQNAQVEGGETIKGDYVFSKMLGFAKLHKPIMKAKGIIEKKPATPERVNAIKMLEQRENNLMMAQEYFKKQHGIK